MKNFKKILALIIACMMTIGMMSTMAWAQTVELDPADADNATITISNAANGETYTIVKLFDATITNPAGTSIAYQGTIPTALASYFVKDATTGEITATAAAKKANGELSDAAQTALKTWATAEAAKNPFDTTVLSGVADGSALVFSALPYGYYVVLTTQGTGSVTVTSTNPNASVVDKNTTEPTIQKKVKDANGNWVEVTDANIGEPKEFKLDVVTTTWHQPLDANGNPVGDQKQVKQYIIGEDFDTNKFELISIDSVQIGTIANDTFTATETITVANNATFPVTIDWIDNAGKSKYSNGAVIRVLYKAKLTDDALIDVGNTDEDLRGNINTADLDWKYTDDEPHFGEGHDHLKDTATVDTYAIGLKKVNKEGTPLAGATFQFPFYVKEVDGKYIYAGTTAGTGLINEITTPTDGQITIQGVKAGTYSITETAAPNGYNKLPGPISVTAVKISTTTTVTETEKKWKIDQDGNIHDYTETVTGGTETTYTNNEIAVTAACAVNMKGVLLPSTGGMGTTIFYIIGGILILGAAIALIGKKKFAR